MSYQMKLDEMQEALSNADHPQAAAFESALCAIGDAMAEALSAALDVEAGATEQHGIGFAGICCPFNPRYSDQPLPEAMAGFDDDDEWIADDDAPPMPKGDQVRETLAELRAEVRDWQEAVGDERPSLGEICARADRILSKGPGRGN